MAASSHTAEMKQLTSIEADLERHLELLENKIMEQEEYYLERSYGGSVATEFSMTAGDSRNSSRRQGVPQKEKVFSGSSCSDEVIERAAGAAEMLGNEHDADANPGDDDDDDDDDWNGKRKRKSSRRRGGRGMEDDED